MSRLKILYVTHEMDPYANLTELGQIARSLPQGMQEKGMEVRVFMPRFGKINERKHRLHEVIRLSGINIPVGDDDNPLIIKVASLPIAKIQIYFLDNEDFFHRKHYLKDENDEFFGDNDDRTIFFNKGVIEIATKLGWIPDIIHCHGWMSSLVPYLARTTYKNEPVFKESKIVYSIYGNDFDGELGQDFIGKSHINGEITEQSSMSAPKVSDLYEVGAKYADMVFATKGLADEGTLSTISSQKEVLTLEYNDQQAYVDEHYEAYQKLLG